MKGYFESVYILKTFYFENLLFWKVENVFSTNHGFHGENVVVVSVFGMKGYFESVYILKTFILKMFYFEKLKTFFFNKPWFPW